MDEIKKEDENLESASDSEISNTDTIGSESSEEETNVDGESNEGSEGDADTGDAENFYKTELEKTRERLGKKIDKERQKRVEAERNQGLSIEEIEERERQLEARLEKKMFRSRAETIAERMAGSPQEKELILLHYDNSIVPTGNIEEDIENAYILANKNNTKSRISELRKAALSKSYRSGGSSAGASIETKRKPAFTQDEINAAEFAGTTPEKLRELAEKRQKLN